MKRIVFIALVLVSLAIAGCVQAAQPQASPTPSPTVLPTATPSPGPEPFTVLAIERVNATTGIEPDGAFLRVLGPDSFSLTANVWAGSPCSGSAAYWTSSEGEVQVYFAHAQPPGIICVQMLESRAFTATLDFTGVFWVTPLRSIKVFNNGGLVKEFKFDGMFCGGIAAFQCPAGYSCVLDGGYPDAGGKCAQAEERTEAAGGEFNITVESNPTTGYGWTAAIGDNTTVAYVGDRFDTGCPGETIAGCGGTQTFTFKALKPGTTTITMVYARPWESVPPAETRVVTVMVASAQLPPQCADSDGDDPWTAGSVTDRNGEHADACYSDTAVIENICDQNGNWGTKITPCAYGCANGACKNRPENYQTPVAVTAGTANSISTGQQFTVALDSNPSTGYAWDYNISNAAVAAYNSKEYAAVTCDSTVIVGCTGKDTFTFNALAPGTVRITFTYARPWATGDLGDIKQFDITVV